MTTLTIKDLPLNEEMDSNHMAAIEGSFSFPPINVAPITRFAAPQPVTKPSNPNGGVIGGGGSSGSGDGGGGDDWLSFGNDPGTGEEPF
jgi:hypothetical protein